ncbi:MAG: hypothetical protein JW775_07210 [Candidatus Aminicenantes bacterium]|nr:hypothetical protein [Candidatus Aminicenantes bacterium]
MNAMMLFSGIDGRGQEFQSVISELFPPGRLEVFRSVERLSEKLRRLHEQESLVVVVVCDKEDLVDLVSLREILHRFRLVLVLPDAEETTISLAHRLRPNYLTYVDSPPGELRAVLERMIEKSESP